MFRNNPGVMLGNNYEPILKSKLYQSMPMEEMEFKELTHITGDVVRGIQSSVTNNPDGYSQKFCFRCEI